MQVVQRRLPLDYPMKDMLRIYGERLYVFAAVIGANCILLMAVSFATVHPLVFSSSLCWILLWIFACWYGERKATAYVNRLGSSRTLSTSGSDSPASMAAFVGLLGLLIGDDSLGDTEHGAAARQMTAPRTVRSVLEEIGRFHREIIAPYLRGADEKSVNETDKEQVFAWQAMALKVNVQVDVALGTLSEGESSRHIVILPISDSGRRLSTYILVEDWSEDGRVERGRPFITVQLGGDDARRRNQLIQSYDSVSRFVSNLAVLERLGQEDALVLILGYLRGAECMCELLSKCRVVRSHEPIQSVAATIRKLAQELAVRVAKRVDRQSTARRTTNGGQRGTTGGNGVNS